MTHRNACTADDATYARATHTTIAFVERCRAMATATLSMVQPRPSANSDEPAISNGALPTANDAGSKTPPTAKPTNAIPLSGTLFKTAGRNVASTPISRIVNACTVCEISRANVNTSSNRGNTATFIAAVTTSMHANAAQRRQKVALRKSNVDEVCFIVHLFYRRQSRKCPRRARLNKRVMHGQAVLGQDEHSLLEKLCSPAESSLRFSAASLS